MPRHEHLVSAEWPGLRVRVHPDVHAAIKARAGYSDRYYRSMSDVANELLKQALKDSTRSRDSVETVDRGIPYNAD